MRTRFLGRLILSSLLVALAGTALAGDFFEKDGVALRGNDPVAYFASGAPRKGVPEHSYTYKGSRFLFATAENLRAFASAPGKYAPQFGGFCAFGAANGYKVSTQPDAFAVVDGKLYLNHDTKVQARWMEDVPGNVAQAEKNWPEVSKAQLKD